MKGKIIILGDTSAPHHPLANIIGLSDLLCNYSLTITNDYDYLFRLDEFDLFICYADAWEKQLNEAQSGALNEYLLNGGKLLGIHNGISLKGIFGAEFTHHPPYCRLPVRTTSSHPVTEGVESFYIKDEPYHYDIYEELNILAVYTFNGKEHPAAWEKQYGKGIIVYLMPGHDESAFKCYGYCRLIMNSVEYLIGVKHL